MRKNVEQKWSHKKRRLAVYFIISIVNKKLYIYVKACKFLSLYFLNALSSQTTYKYLCVIVHISFLLETIENILCQFFSIFFIFFSEENDISLLIREYEFPVVYLSF